MNFHFPEDITLMRYSDNNTYSELFINHREYENNSKIDCFLDFSNLFQMPFINQYYTQNPDILRYFEVYHQDYKLSSQNSIQLKKSFKFDNQTNEPNFLCQNTRLEMYKYLDIEDIKSLSLVSKEFLYELRKNQTIKFLKQTSKLKFFTIINHTCLHSIPMAYNYKEYELWWLYSMNSYFNIIRKRWHEYIQDMEDIYGEELESLNIMERMINDRLNH
jgi:hypothetical protein